jgi:two-component system, cell cycle sensor histidine kinase and response regulator CckA
LGDIAVLINPFADLADKACAVRCLSMRVLDPEKPVTTEIAPPLRVLLLEESDADSQEILQELRSAGMAIETTVIARRGEFLEAISSQDYSVILSAYKLPEWSGMEALQELRKAGKQTPFILVTGVLGEDAAVECLKQGVNDYVLKNRLARLPMALRRALEEKQLREANHEARRALQESETRNRELIESSAYGVFRVSLDGSFVLANPALLHILACSSLQVLRSLNLSTDVFRFPEQYVKLLASCRRDGLVQSAEAEWRRKDGGMVAVKLHLRYLPSPGAADEMEGIVEDVTELRSLERQVMQAQKFETIGQLAGGIAHDFNNVVGAILGWAELGYEQSKAYPAIAERFARIRDQADRAAALTRELLAFARRQELQARPIDLNSIIHKLTAFLEKVIGSDIEMKVTLGSLQVVQADPVQIEQVLMNLCLNARDAMPEGGRLLIETEMVNLDDSFCRSYPSVTPGCYAALSVSDTGIGMTPEIRDRIFEPFFTTKERGASSGMGLATAYGIAKQHGGFIHFHSEPGMGSLFRVYLPAMSGGRSDAAPKSADADASLPVKLEGTETVLLAEDHDSVREMVRQWLVNFGYRILSAANGEEALKLCEQETPAMAILDMVMPRMSGAATAAELRKRFPDLPILFTSGYSKTGDANVAQLANSSYLQKPYSPTSLGRTIRRILDPVALLEG